MYVGECGSTLAPAGSPAALTLALIPVLLPGLLILGLKRKP